MKHRGVGKGSGGGGSAQLAGAIHESSSMAMGAAMGEHASQPLKGDPKNFFGTDSADLPVEGKKEPEGKKKAGVFL